ncbi:unnamed protein product [Pleuronectes platessa]|uniref:Uncharacterized protein n=1 Tax=Pleuronectes platessa TaxID=8262 RepID=A0A9N7UTB2_PLEPL|nr:unnamed protein product [Pleuronectes platessa]
MSSACPSLQFLFSASGSKRLVLAPVSLRLHRAQPAPGLVTEIHMILPASSRQVGDGGSGPSFSLLGRSAAGESGFTAASRSELQRRRAASAPFLFDVATSDSSGLVQAPQTRSWFLRPAPGSSDLVLVPQTCSWLLRPGPCILRPGPGSSDLLKVPQTCSWFLRPAPGSSDLVLVPQTCSWLLRPGLVSSDLVLVPQTCSRFLRPAPGSSDLVLS